MTRLLAAAAAMLGVLALGAPTPSHAQTVRIELAKAGFIIGVQGGSGTLTYQGKRYPLRVGGVSLGATVGASSAVLVGSVRNLRRVEDIAGAYAATEAGFAVVTGRKEARLRNAKGVVLVLRGHQVGLEFALDLNGIDIALR